MHFFLVGAGVEGHFAVNIANSASINGPYTLNASWDTPLIRKVNGSSWIENPIVSTLPGGKFATVFDWVQGGGRVMERHCRTSGFLGLRTESLGPRRTES